MGIQKAVCNGHAQKSYDIFIRFKPLIAASGTLDLIALASYIPIFGQAVKVADIVLEASGIDASFFIKASGNIEGTATLKLGDTNTKTPEADLALKNDIKVRVEASITLGGGLVGFLFAAGDWIGNKVTEYQAYAETGLSPEFKIGIDGKGIYINAKLDFLGLVFVAQKVDKDNNDGLSKTKKLGPYEVIKKSKLLGAKYYLNNDNTKSN